jgi:hypothetical protein
MSSFANDNDHIIMAGLPADFPIRLASLGHIVAAPAPVNISPFTSNANGTATAPAAPAIIRPVVTLVNVFPGPEGHVYHDADDKTPKPDAYITVQRKILQWLDTHAADMLMPELAATWNYQIDPIDRYPSPELSISLCYYMREQGFNTYCRLIPSKSTFELYIANPLTNHRGPQIDACYWYQSYKTGTIREVSLRQALRGRRGAFQANTGFGLLGSGLSAVRQRVVDAARGARVHHEEPQMIQMETRDPRALLLSEQGNNLARDLRQMEVSPGNGNAPTVPELRLLQQNELRRYQVRLEVLLSRPATNAIQEYVSIPSFRIVSNELTTTQ